MNFATFLESSLGELYTSAVQAFPATTKRQHATDTIKIAEMRWTPFLGVRTLLVRATAQNFRGGGGEYKPVILFKNVQYHDLPNDNTVPLIASNENVYHLEPLRRANQDVLVRCNCKDFYWRFNYCDHLDSSLHGAVRAPYVAISERPPANPEEMPGMCKHLMKLMYALQDAGILS